MKIDFTALEKAVASLDRAVRRSTAAPADEELRDAVIQRFEYTHELAFKMLKRQLEQESPTPEHIDHLAYNDLIREARERGFPVEVENWSRFRRARNLTSHAYDEAKAREVHTIALEFLPHVRHLLDTLLQRPAR